MKTSVKKESSSVTRVYVSMLNGDVTAREIVRTLLMRKTAVSY
jgi:hypothetical protein